MSDEEQTARPDPWRAWLVGRERQALTLPQFRRAAVLVGLTSERDPRVLLTVRADDLPTHRGHVSFPGGRLEDGETPTQGALREAWEEVGLAEDVVEILGELDDAFTPVGSFHVTPVLARVPAEYSYAPNAEVARVVLPPLRELRAGPLIVEERTLPNGETYPLYRFPWRGLDIWGMTARILREVVQSQVM